MSSYDYILLSRKALTNGASTPTPRLRPKMKEKNEKITPTTATHDTVPSHTKN
ncbi:hypothetical protein [Campylobacter sp.]|uniref:hypothetical protein n=1 Tax=Campylobacter sp. TaxID=205 RepID=UPI002AA89CB5|nr:hypothetical protein [Campylobacter sp.]MCI6661601.1 hypothetical protein [Campylobacter sp.]MCI7550667.1 hypothetical protein [Campylobacter sp.]